MTSKGNITIAIVGGGLGGVTTAIALGRIGYNVHLIEQASEFSEIGAGVGIGPNSFKAFQLLGIGEEYAKIADEVPSWFRYLNWSDGAEITHVMAKGTNTFVHRKRVLEVLLKLVPSNVTKHFSSHVTEANNIPATDGKPARVLLQILPSELHHHPDWPADPWSIEADAVIGCDGIKSTVRNSIKLGDGPDRGGRVRYTGTYAYRGLLPMEEAVKQCGELVREPLLWLAPDKHLLSFPVEGGSIVNIVAFVSDRSAPPDDRQWTAGAWVKPVEMDVMLADFKDWDKIPTALLKLIDKPQQWALHELVPLERWTNGRITLLGDSAHASLPHNGAGAGQAIEDAYVLGELLALPECNAETIPHFLQAYEDVRRERASKQQIHSRNSGEIYDYVSPLGDDKARIAEQLQTHYDWIWVHDHKADVENAKIGLKSAGLL